MDAGEGRMPNRGQGVRFAGEQPGVVRRMRDQAPFLSLCPRQPVPVPRGDSYFAKALNCKKGPVQNPCEECHNCKEITEGISVDVLEIDAASNRGVDEIRAIRDNVKFAPRHPSTRTTLLKRQNR